MLDWDKSARKLVDAGSTLKPPAWQSLTGPWIDGKDPAGS